MSPAARPLFLLGSILFADSQPLDESLVAAELRSLQVIQQTPALTHQFEQAAARGVVLLMGFQVSRQVLDSLSQYGNLHFGRTRILVVQLVV